MLAGPSYSSAYAASSPTVSRSSSQPSPPIRVPRYLRRYTICTATNSTQWQHRPTSPLANSFTPDDYHHPPPWARRRSDSFSPKVKSHYAATSAFPASHSTPVLSRAQSLVTPATHRPANHIFLRPSSTCSVSSLMTDCSFHTAYDPSDTPIDSSAIDHLKNDSSDSSTSGIASRGAQSSSDDTVVSPSDPVKKETKQDDEDDDDLEQATKNGEWPAPFLMTITRQDLDQYDKQQLKKQQQQQQPKRTFTWGRKHGRNSSNNDSQELIPTIGRTKSRKLKKKRPDSLLIVDDQEQHQQPFQARILSIYTQDDLEEFDPLKDLPTSSLPSPEEPSPPPASAADTDILTPSSPQKIGIAISSDDDDDIIPQIDPHPTILPITDEWEDVDSSDPHHDYRHSPSSSHDDDDDQDDDSPPPPERIRSRTPQEILQGLDVVHEESEEEDSIIIKPEEEDPRADHLEKRQSYPFIKNKGKQRQESNNDDHDEDEADDIHHHEEHIDEEEEKEIEQPVVVVPPLQDIDTHPIESETHQQQPEAQPSKENQTPPSSPRRKKLSKRRQSKRALDTDSPLPERNLTTKSSKSKSKSNIRTKPSIQTIHHPRPRPQRTSSLISHIFRPLALLLGININHTNHTKRTRSIRTSKKRLSRELRTPNALLLGRHFSEKHIPRFPSRLDGKRTVDKKVVRYE